MKTTTYTYTEDEREINLTAVCLSRQGLENIERACADTEEGAALELNVIPHDSTDYLPEGWYIVEAERGDHHEWRGYTEAEALLDTLRGCEPALADASAMGLGDLVNSDELRAEIFVCVDEAMDEAPEQIALHEAAAQLREYAERNGIDGFAELAVAAHKFFAQTAIAHALGLSIKYEPDYECIRVAGRPVLALSGKVDDCFAGNIIRDLDVEDVAQVFVDETHFVEYDYREDELFLREEA